MHVLVTGAAGFIGYHLTQRLLARGDSVVGVDCLDAYYDVALKVARLGELGIDCPDEGGETVSTTHEGLRFSRLRLEDGAELRDLLRRHPVDRIVHLAGQAGVRYSIDHPEAYISANVEGHLTILELARALNVEHLVYASSSSVYGNPPVAEGAEPQPFSTSQRVDSPVSLYAATKRAGELMTSAYAKLFGIPSTGLRFFTVYGPWGRPDMAYFKFVRAILEGRPIDVYNHGDLARDFTYVDDIVEGVVRVLDSPPPPTEPGAEDDGRPHRVYNIGRGKPVPLMTFIATIEDALGKVAAKRMLPMQPGDVSVTWADTAALERDVGYRPSTPLSEGVARFVDWYREYFEVG